MALGRTYFQDEMRCGTRTEAARRWMPLGERPCCPVRIGYQYSHLYAAICPATGDLFALFLPHVTVECFLIFQREFHEHLDKNGSQPALLVLDRASAHRFAPHHNPQSLTRLLLPSASPELNPVERFFKELRKHLKCRIFHSLDEVHDRLESVLKKYWENPNLVVSITNFPYLNTTP